MEVRKQTADNKPQEVITKDEWTDLSRKLLAKPSVSVVFSNEERVAIAGFINYVADDVEEIQVER